MNVLKIKQLLFICLFCIIAGFPFQYFTEGSVNHNAVIVGFILGLGFGILELFLLSSLNRRLKLYPALIILVTKSILYTIIVFVLSNLIGLITGYLEGRNIEEFFAALLSKTRIYMILYALIVYFVMLFIMQLNRLLGPGVMLKFLFGKYIRPVEEERIFMFLDIKSSTTLAENLGHEKFYTLLNEFFHGMTTAVLSTKAEIYQYVGDEVVFTWKMSDGIDNLNCLRIFYLIKENVNKNKQNYLKRFEAIPDFKAGMHCGKVIIGQIGDVKREIVYNGDVLNTTARIRDLCNNYDKDLLISGPLLEQFKKPLPLSPEFIGEVLLRGKQDAVDIYSIEYQNIPKKH